MATDFTKGQDISNDFAFAAFQNTELSYLRNIISNRTFLGHCNFFLLYLAKHNFLKIGRCFLFSFRSTNNH